jgi:class 3 adenylate cyclase
VSVCSKCGQDNPSEARFCASCGNPLSPGRPDAREERKIVSVLFADLVGFTERSEQADPEDVSVRATLSPYFATAKEEIERFGGSVEKFIGDAVMAVFGAPIAHEDDPERAVRAALRITDVIEQLNRDGQRELHVRVAVNTGEALCAHRYTGGSSTEQARAIPVSKACSHGEASTHHLNWT